MNVNSRDSVALDARNFTYLSEIDGIRAICISLVLIGHLGFGAEIPGAALGVTVFFFISGYLISNLAIKELWSSGEINLTKFYVRRFKRLFPAAATMIFVVCFSSFLINKTFPWQEFLASVFYIANYYKLYVGYDLPLSPLWSLAVEEHYYILFPLIFPILIRRLGIIGTLLASLGCCMFVLVWRIIAVTYFSAGYEYVARSTETRLDSIIFGVVLALLMNSPWADGWRIICKAKTSIFLAVLILFSSFIFNQEIIRNTIKYTLQGVSMVVLTTSLFSCGWLSFARAFLSLKPLVWLGKLSYSIYLWHSACFVLVAYVFAQYGTVWLVIASVVTSLLSATFSYYLIEMPFRGSRRSGAVIR